MIPNHQGGCVNCGVQGIKELRLKTDKGSEVRLWFCEQCTLLPEYDFIKIKDALLKQEGDLLKERGKPLSLLKSIERLVFVSVEK